MKSFGSFVGVVRLVGVERIGFEVLRLSDMLGGRQLIALRLVLRLQKNLRARKVLVGSAQRRAVSHRITGLASRRRRYFEKEVRGEVWLYPLECIA